MRKQRLAFSRRELKMLAKRLMFHPICMRVTLLLVGLQVAFVGLRYLLGATLTYGVASLAQYGDTVSGIYFNSEGFSILFRMDLTQMVLAIPVTYAQLIRFVVFSVVVLLILAPIRLGVMEQYWSMLRGWPLPPWCSPSGCTASFCRCGTACAPTRNTPWARSSAGGWTVPRASGAPSLGSG